LLFAFEQDQLVKRYPTYEQLLEYCRHSANPVGHLVLYLCGLFTPERAELSDHVCTGLQLANFWQDVGRDLDIGRVYLPEEDMKRFHYPREELLERRCTREFTELMRFEVERTRDLFYRGFPLVERVPQPFRVDMELFIRGGLGVLHKIEQIGYNVFSRRPTLSKFDQASLLAGAVWRRLRAAMF
jgi:squalene synthase HpnC